MLHHIGPIHCRGDPEAMPVDDRRLRKSVREPNLKDIANLGLDRRAGNLAVERPGPGRTSRAELPIDFGRFELDGNDSTSRRRLGGFVRAFIRFPPIDRAPMSDRSVAGAACVRLVMNGRMVVAGVGHGSLPGAPCSSDDLQPITRTAPAWPDGLV
jgi:hypothetical protein